KHSGQVRWLLSSNTPRRDTYRDKYIKFAYSSHYPFNNFSTKDQCPADQSLVFRDPANGKTYARQRVLSGELTKDGLTTTWELIVGTSRVQIATLIRLDGEFEFRQHTIDSPIALEVFEGSHPLGTDFSDKFESDAADQWRNLKSHRKL